MKSKITLKSYIESKKDSLYNQLTETYRNHPEDDKTIDELTSLIELLDEVQEICEERRRY